MGLKLLSKIILYDVIFHVMSMRLCLFHVYAQAEYIQNNSSVIPVFQNGKWAFVSNLKLQIVLAPTKRVSLSF